MIINRLKLCDVCRRLSNVGNSSRYFTIGQNSALKASSSSSTKKDPAEELMNTKVPTVVKPSLFDRLKQSFGMQGNLRYPQPLLQISAQRLYLCIQYQIDYDKFFKKCDMPDVMYSFCLVTFLHVWLISVALMHYGQTGLFVRKSLHANMWTDIQTRERKLNAPMNKENKLKAYNQLNDTFRAHVFGFDEGLLSDDTVLAGAVWRHLLEMKPLNDYAVLGELCEYIRKNVNHLEKLSETDLLKYGIVSFIDFEQKELDHSLMKVKIFEKINRR